MVMFLYAFYADYFHAAQSFFVTYILTHGLKSG